MKVQSLIATALIAFASQAAMAATVGEFDVPDLGTSTRSRAEVRAEAVQAAADRLHAVAADEFTAPGTTAPTALTLSARRAEARKTQAHRFHEVALDPTV